jgi:hypothetical protein
LLDVILAIAAAWLIDVLPISAREKSLTALLLVAGTLFFGLRYDINFVLDRWPNSTRMQAAVDFEKSNVKTIAVWAEPAPYCLPPVDLFDRQIVLEPRGSDGFSLPPDTVGVRPVDDPKPSDPLSPRRAVTPISWANKPFEILNSSPVSTRRGRP